MTLTYILLTSALAGAVQGVAGFGFGLIVMVVFPLLLDMTEAAFLSQTIAVFLSAAMIARYWRSIQWRKLLLPLMIYLPVFYGAFALAAGMDTIVLKPYLGLLLVVLSIWGLCFAKRAAIRANAITAGVCAGIGAILTAAFGIGGPPMALYFLAATKDQREYLGTLQMFFVLVNSIGSALRIFSGSVDAGIITPLLLSLVGMLIGTMIAARIVDRIDLPRLTYGVYAVTGIAGLITVLTSI